MQFTKIIPVPHTLMVHHGLTMRPATEEDLRAAGFVRAFDREALQREALDPDQGPKAHGQETPAPPSVAATAAPESSGKNDAEGGRGEHRQEDHHG